MSALPPKADIPPPAISGGAELEYPSWSVTPLIQSVTVRMGGRAVSVENLRLREVAPTSVNVTVGKRSREYLTDREVERPLWASRRHRDLGRLPPRPQGLGAGGTALGRHRPRRIGLLLIPLAAIGKPCAPRKNLGKLAMAARPRRGYRLLAKNAVSVTLQCRTSRPARAEAASRN
jgi:hypothetical protein